MLARSALLPGRLPLAGGRIAVAPLRLFATATTSDVPPATATAAAVGEAAAGPEAEAATTPGATAAPTAPPPDSMTRRAAALHMYPPRVAGIRLEPRPAEITPSMMKPIPPSAFVSPVDAEKLAAASKTDPSHLPDFRPDGILLPSHSVVRMPRWMRQMFVTNSKEEVVEIYREHLRNPMTFRRVILIIFLGLYIGRYRSRQREIKVAELALLEMIDAQKNLDRVEQELAEAERSAGHALEAGPALV
ncbi:hypothetical protein H696_06036 [Fonticula alba]|uniref:Uncharacterized protein n=1 Tax=Fonticula alba TaxID=691883 RepID=A0A058Z1Z8_FONAL|nr:hypothetical protein H696_06036 [Fonticula alba]KCV67517.1 hypothetical protein H696_06036 [Fonticula alba]|eukprot:XP_009498078.1 hypothetical protein H696_06036 [Fonticula alba]